MKNALVPVFLFFSLFAVAQVATLEPGDAAPGFDLKDVNGKMISSQDYPDAKGFIMIFTSNTCPYAIAYEQRIIALHNKFAPQGYPVIAINPNDPEVAAGDSFDKMQQKASEEKFTFPYLFDPGQQVTDQYGAMKTPHVFLVKKENNGNRIVYTGAIDNDTEDKNPGKTKYVEEAISSLQNGKNPEVTETKAIGCTVKRKSRT